MIAPVRWLLERIAACATRDERLDEVEEQLRAALARAEKAEAQLARWRPVVEAAEAQYRSLIRGPNSHEQRTRFAGPVVLATKALLDAEGRS